MKGKQYINLNKFKYHSQPHKNIHELLFDEKFQIRSLELSDGGQNGVFFIQTHDGSFVLKSNNDAPLDYFYNKFAQLQKVNTPKIRILNCFDNDYAKLVYAIQKYCQKDQNLYQIVKNRLNFPFYQIMQYIQSISLVEVGPQKYNQWLVNQYQFYSMGLCIAYDIIINNSDRFRFLWNGNGNIHNILIQIQAKTIQQIQLCKDRKFYNNAPKCQKYIFIDHTGCMLDHNDRIAKVNLEKYFEKIVKFYLQIIELFREENNINFGNSFQKLRQQIEFYCHHKLTDNQCLLVAEGIIYGTQLFLKNYQMGLIDNLCNTMEKNSGSIKKDILYWENHWNQDLVKIRPQYLKDIYVKISAIFATYPQIVNAILEKVEETLEKRKQFDQKLEQNNLKNSQQDLKSHDTDNNDDIRSNNHQDHSNNVENYKKSQIKDQINHNSKRWRQKLSAFKQFNYR